MDIMLSILIAIVGVAGGAAVAFLFGRFGKGKEKKNTEFTNED